jgi:ABC-type sugar transport system permease subunit
MSIDPTANAGYATAAYVVTAVILVGYSLVLWRKSRRANRK